MRTYVHHHSAQISIMFRTWLAGAGLVKASLLEGDRDSSHSWSGVTKL